MFKKNLLIFLIAITFSKVVFAEEKITKETTQIEAWNSADGLKKLQKSSFKNDFYQLINFYQPQENPLYCSVAVATIISNALDYGKIPSQKASEIKIPQSNKIIEYRLYQQKTFLNKKTEEIKKLAIIELKQPKTTNNNQEIYDGGINLSDFNKMLSIVHGFKTKLTYAAKNDEESIKKFRDKLKEVLLDDKSFVIANFDGKITGSLTNGHFSPIVAFDESSDSVLILDVALHKNQWYWTSLKKLYEAMNSKDEETYRGYLIISR
jgi:hypothetical protein